MNNKKISTEELNTIAAMRASGKPWKDIGQLLGLSESQLRRRFTKYNRLPKSDNQSEKNNRPYPSPIPANIQTLPTLPSLLLKIPKITNS